MDIDAAIARMRDLSRAIDSPANEDIIPQLAEEMCQVWDGIDEWLRKGGMFPAAWLRVRH